MSSPHRPQRSEFMHSTWERGSLASQDVACSASDDDRREQAHNYELYTAYSTLHGMAFSIFISQAIAYIL